MSELKNIFADRSILLVAPGKSVKEEYAKVKKVINAFNPVVVCINAVIPDIKTRFYFLL